MDEVLLGFDAHQSKPIFTDGIPYYLKDIAIDSSEPHVRSCYHLSSDGHIYLKTCYGVIAFICITPKEISRDVKKLLESVNRFLDKFILVIR